MNSNAHHQTSDNTFFNTPITSASIHLIINQINSLQNPTTEDFERIIQQFEQYFFHIIQQQRFYSNLKFSYSHQTSLTTLNLHIVTCGKRLPQ